MTSFLIRDILRREDADENESVVVDSDGEQQNSPLSAGTNSDTEESLLKDSYGKETGTVLCRIRTMLPVNRLWSKILLISSFPYYRKFAGCETQKKKA